MAFFAMPYRVLFHDTMAQGSHHFLTNFKFQCEAREHFFFGLANDPSPAATTLLETLDLITLDAYSRNLAPVGVGEKVGILMSVEDQTPSAFRLCFRAIRQDGKPVACGFQSVLCTVRQTGQVMVSPEPLYAFAPLREKLRQPSFRDRVLSGGSAIKDLFDEHAIRIATAAAAGFEPRIVPDILLPPLGHLRRREEADGVVLLFPGQGSWDAPFLLEIQRRSPAAARSLQAMDRVAEADLGRGFLAACENDSAAARLAAEHPDVMQVGIYAAGVTSARYLIDRGVSPSLLLGHSFGELAALAVGGAFSDEEGAALVCHRIRALQGVRQPPGGMLAVLSDETRTRALIESVRPSTIEVAVVNHPSQTVVSGTTADLDRFAAILAGQQVTVIRLKSRYPFHSSLLQDAVAPFAAAVERITAAPLRIAVYSAGDAGLHARQPDLALLARHLVQPAVFTDAVESAYALGGRTFIECGGGRVLCGLVQQNLSGRPGVTTLNLLDHDVPQPLVESPPANAPRPAIMSPTAQAAPAPEPLPGATAAAPRLDESGPVPIAVVSIGCVLPGAANPETLWRRLLARETGLVDLGILDPTLAADFKADQRMTSDKTYSLLCGHVRAEDRQTRIAGITESDLARLPTVGRFFAQAASQCLAGLQSTLPASDRICCVVGSTADGSRELDEALVTANVDAHARASGAAAAAIEMFGAALETVSSLPDAAAGELSCGRAFRRVGRQLFGPNVSVLAVDAACASSLYAIDIGVDALRQGRSDVAICGGAFAPGPASTCLFAQFQGLSATGSKPLDAGADGVVFGEGSALAVLKRLPDAIAAGDRIHAVIRAVAASSDGKSASVMEPKQGGQLLAIRRAAERSGVPPSTLQFIDAHATATPVGDAVEFTSLREAVGPPVANRPPVRVASLKAAIGHTGWVAGAASLVEICQALQARTFPPQLAFSTPNPKFQLSGSNIAIEAQPSAWPANQNGMPRRAGINGFGFGGCNAHVILEEFEPACHRVAPTPATENRKRDALAIVGFNRQWPENQRSDSVGAWCFARGEVHLPAPIRLLPDVADNMDAGQLLAIRTAQAIIATLPPSWQSLKPDTGVIIGFDGKTRRGIDALLPINLDRIKRRLAEARRVIAANEVDDFDRIAEHTLAAIRRMPSSGPYTLAGTMPNVIAGRVANVFNFNGPNLVVDSERHSLVDALDHAQRQLESGACRLVFAGGISSSVGPDIERVVRTRPDADGRPLGEAAIMLALASVETAESHDLPILGYLSTLQSTMAEAGTPVLAVGSGQPAFFMGAEGALELDEAFGRTRERAHSTIIRWPARVDGLAVSVRVTGKAARVAADAGTARPAVVESAAKDTASGPLRMPLRWTAPEWVPADAPPARASVLRGRRLLVLTDHPTQCLSPAARAALGRNVYRIVCPIDRAIPGALSVDLSSDATARQTLLPLEAWPYDAIVVISDLARVDAIDGVTGARHVNGGLLDLLFAVTRHAYDRLRRGEVAIGAVCLNAAGPPEPLNPVTGMHSGFLRSLAIEVPDTPCCQVNTSNGDLAAALDHLDRELEASRTTGVREVCWQLDRRYVQRLIELAPVSEGTPTLTRDSVVVATGGARGVTAVLVEALRREFGCTTVLLGRSDPEDVPADLRALDHDAFDRFEPEFYQRELAARPGIRPADLKATYRRYGAAREVAETMTALGTLPGALRYIQTDVTNPTDVDRAIQRVKAEFSRVDFVIHGAGIQTSKALPHKKLEDFRAIVATKLGGLGHLIRSCRAHFANSRIHWHLVTSTFSHTGNDGQQDYGAANLAMDRLAASLRSGPAEFEASSLGWIGWVNVGMTKGSEYANLAIQRRLGGVTREKGKTCFREFARGRATSPVTYVMTDLEAAYFKLSIAPAAAAPIASARPLRLEQSIGLDCATYPFLRDHTVNGVPTVPAAFGLELAARVASALRPELDIQRFIDIRVDRFVKVPIDGAVELRGVAEILEETNERCRILVRLLRDFTHASGQVLQRDIVHMSTEVWLGRAAEPTVDHEPVTTVPSAWRLIDPYSHDGAPVRLRGPFESLDDIQLTPTHSTAVFHGPGASDLTTISSLFVPFILLDALWRMASMRREDDGMAPVYVPLGCAEVGMLSGIDAATLAAPCLLTSSVPQVDGRKVRMAWAEATDATGRVLVTLTDLVGIEYGRVPAEVERIRSARIEIVEDRTASSQSQATAGSRTMPRSLAGRIAFVTGSGRGLGKVVAMKLAERGAFVVVNSFHAPEKGEETTAEILARGGAAMHVWGSVAQPAHLERMFGEIDARAGGLDFLVSNASAGLFGKMENFTPELWLRSFRTNVVGLHQAALLAAERMRPRGGGRIIALSSIGTRLCFEFFGLIGPVKAAVDTLVKYLAVELSPANVQVAAIAAGAIDGELLRQQNGRPLWENLAPNRRLLTEEEVADAVMFWLMATGMNGATLVVDGAVSLPTVEQRGMHVSQGGRI